MSTPTRWNDLTPNERRLVRLMQRTNFGRVKNLVVRDGQPTFDPAPRTPVWTTLYILMAIAAQLVWKPTGFRDAKTPLALFTLQLVLNVCWSWVYFGLHQLGWAAVEIVVLWLAIVATIVVFFRRSTLSGWLMAPYLVWVSFAVVLNHAIWQLNSGVQ